MKDLILRFAVVFCLVIISSPVFAQNPGDILINEVMQNPSKVTDTNGEWFELYNNTDSPIDINGWIIKDSGTDDHTIDNGGPLYVPARGYLVLGRNGNYSSNGGYNPDYVYSGIQLANGDDEIILINGTTEINRIEYDGGAIWPAPDGASMAWDGIGSNNNGSNWHEETTVTYGDGDYGSPGSWNPGSAIAVELTVFTAQSKHNYILLTWTTQTETENLGFHLYRSLTEDGEYTKITKELIPGSGNSDEAHSYSYIDCDLWSGNTRYYKLADVDFGGNMHFHGPVSVTVEALPAGYTLEQNYPNPFNPETSIKFALKEAGKVSLKIYDLQGRLVRILVDEHKPAGSYVAMWNGNDERGVRIASGIYLFTLKVNGLEQTKKLMFMR